MQRKVMPSWIINLFFYTGVVSALLFRSTIIVNRFNTHLGRIIWYIAVCGYIFFFGYRFYISLKRRRVIKEEELIQKIEGSNLEKEDRENVKYLLNSLQKSKEMINYVLIFLLSGVAIMVDLTLTLLK